MISKGDDDDHDQRTTTDHEIHKASRYGAVASGGRGCVSILGL
jgi:hypothetical protein